MRSTLLSLSLVIAVVGPFACKSAEPRTDTAAAGPVGSSAAPAPPAMGECAPQAALDRMDTRGSVPLLPMMANHQKRNMRDHLVAVQEIVAALATSDFAAIERSAGRIGYSEQMGAMCTHMGAGAPGFTEQAIAFHKTADGIAAAAKSRDGNAVLSALGTTLKTCTGCHATWKQKIVDEATFGAVTPPGGMAHP
jgi:cytochrome c556